METFEGIEIEEQEDYLENKTFLQTCALFYFQVSSLVDFMIVIRMIIFHLIMN